MNGQKLEFRGKKKDRPGAARLPDWQSW